MIRPTRVQIDLSALRHNLDLLKQWNGLDAFFCPMVKANAYGHGDVTVAKAVVAAGCSALGVALYEEGLTLREAAVRAPILVFAPVDKTAVSAALTHGLIPVAGRMEDLQAIGEVAGRAKIPLHLKFNTGMCRLGFDHDELSRVRDFLKAHPALQVTGVCTHLTHGEEAADPDGHTARQLAKFRAMSEGFPGVRHAHKSASLAALAEKGVRKDPDLGARPGISIYGLPQDGHKTAAGLKPVLSWKSTLIRTHDVEKNQSVSYGARWVATRRSCIGFIPAGYGDGYMRALSNRGTMLFRGRRVPVVGSVCMDYTLIDLTDACGSERPRAGEEIVLIGRQGGEEVTAAELAQAAGTIGYEIATAISRRVAREVV
jgi:alanine racemase